MPAPTKVQLTGGHFQDSSGNPLALGYLVMELVQDEQLSSLAGQVVAGIKIKITLESGGSVATTSPVQAVWSPENMVPAGASYTVWGYTAQGQLAWGPNYGLDVPIGATFDVDNWVPNTTGGGSGSTGGLTLQTNEANNGSQQLLDLHAGTNITLVDNGSGQVTIAASGSAPGGPRPSIASWNYAKLNFSGMPGIGISLASVPGTLLPATAIDSAYFTETTGSSNFVIYDQEQQMSFGLFKDAQWRVLTPSSSNIRYWIAMTSYPAPSAGFLESDTPDSAISGFSVIGFRYSTFAGDTHWQCYASDTAGHHIIVDSGVAIDHTLGHNFEVSQPTAGTLEFYIDSVLVGTLTTTLPATSTLFQMNAWMDQALSVGSIEIGINYFYWESSK